MKNVINYYYSLNPNDIYQRGKNYFFELNNNYVFYLYEGNIDEINDIFELSNLLINNNIYCHQIVLNNEKSVLTKVNDNYYILMQYFVSLEKIDYKDILLLNRIPFNNDKFKRNDWFLLWTKKIDYFEYQISQIGKKFPLIRESFSYFVGLAELGICLFKNSNTNTITYISHRRINKDSTLFDLYNPLNIIADTRSRDISEYFKSNFDNNILINVENYIYQNNLNETECLLLFIRFLFCSFYFDLYENIIDGKVEEEKIITVIEKIDSYELFLKQFYFYLKNKNIVPIIEWLEKT